MIMVFGQVFNEYITFKVTFFINSLSLEYYADVHKKVFGLTNSHWCIQIKISIILTCRLFLKSVGFNFA